MSAKADYHFPFSDHDAVSIKINTCVVERGPDLWKLNTSILSDIVYINQHEEFWSVWLHDKSKYNSVKKWWDLFKHHVKNIYIEYCKNLSKIRKKNIDILEIKLNKLKQYNSTNDESIANIDDEIADFYVRCAAAAPIRYKEKFYFEYEKSNSYFSLI